MTLKKKYTEFYEYNPRTCKYELNESVGKEQIAKAVIPDDFFAYDGLKFSALGSKLSSADLEKLSKAQLRLMRNAVYARHGRTFKSTDLQSLWECYAWYKKNPAYSDELLTDIDKYNIRLIKMFEERRRVFYEEMSGNHFYFCGSFFVLLCVKKRRENV